MLDAYIVNPRSPLAPPPMTNAAAGSNVTARAASLSRCLTAQGAYIVKRLALLLVASIAPFAALAACGKEDLGTPDAGAPAPDASSSGPRADSAAADVLAPPDARPPTDAATSTDAHPTPPDGGPAPSVACADAAV